jgi:hypothetical protein
MPWVVLVCQSDGADRVWGVVARHRTAERIKGSMESQGHWMMLNPEGKLALAQIRVKRVPWREVRPANPFKLGRSS